MRLFGIDITGFTFGISGVNSVIDDAEERFMQPKKLGSFSLEYSPKTIVRSSSAEGIPRKNYETNTAIDEDIVVSQEQVNI